VDNQNEAANYFYAGHGQRPSASNENGGNLCTADKQSISLQEFCITITNAGFKMRVQIVTNCCYSGCWPILAEKLWEKKDDCVKQFRGGLSVESSCDARTAVQFGAFKELTNRKLKDGMNMFGMGGDGSYLVYLHNTHVPKYGYAKFDSEHPFTGIPGGKPLLEYYEKDPVPQRAIWVHPDANTTEHLPHQVKLMKLVKEILKTDSNDVFWAVSTAEQAIELMERTGKSLLISTGKLGLV